MCPNAFTAEPLFLTQSDEMDTICPFGQSQNSVVLFDTFTHVLCANDITSHIAQHMHMLRSVQVCAQHRQTSPSYLPFAKIENKTIFCPNICNVQQNGMK